MATGAREELLIKLLIERRLIDGDALHKVQHTVPAPTLDPEEARFGPRLGQLLRAGLLSASQLQSLAAELSRSDHDVNASRIDTDAAPAKDFDVASGELAAELRPSFLTATWSRYEFLSVLGQGGMGIVYLARDRQLGRTAALKFLHADDAQRTQRFLQEARAQARIDHDHVCKVYEVGEVEGRAYIAMQYLDGAPLSALKERLTLEDKVMLLATIADAVHAAHRQGIVHRDLKPGNVMVQRPGDGTLRATVMDFGLAHDPQAAAQLTRSGAVLGTPAYMSPEQARGDTRSVDRRSDVYSLGAMLYELLALRPPFLGSSTVETLFKVTQEDPPQLRKLAPTVPRDLETIAHKCLAKAPHHRYESAQALRHDLRAYLDGEPILARPPGALRRVLARLSRHRLLFAVSLLSLLALTVMSAVLIRARLQAARQLRLAQIFSEESREIESIMQHGFMSPLHDIGRERALAQKVLQRIEERMHSEGAVATGPGHYALGRGYLAMQAYAPALTQLESARRAGYRTPGLSYAMGRTLAELYQIEWARSEFINNAEAQKLRREELLRLYKQPAIEQLTVYVSAGSEVGAGELDYVEALLAYCRGDYAQALLRAEQALAKLPWLYDAKRLVGDAHLALGMRRVETGEFEAALTAFALAGAAYEQAAQFGRSDALLRNGLAKRWLQTFGAWSLGLGHPPGTQLQSLLTTVAESLTIEPGQLDAYRIELEGYQFLLQYREARGQLGLEIDQAITLAEKLYKTMPELGPSLHQYYMLKCKYDLDHGADLTQIVTKANRLAEEMLRSKNVLVANPATVLEMSKNAAVLELQQAARVLATGNDPALAFQKIERWLDEMRQLPAAKLQLQLVRIMYLSLQAETLLKQGLAPLQKINEALDILEKLDGKQIDDAWYYRNFIYMHLINYQARLRVDIGIDRKRLARHLEQTEAAQAPWTFTNHSMLGFYVALINLALHDGDDPRPAFDRLFRTLALYRRETTPSNGEREEAQAQLFKLGWLLRAAQPSGVEISASIASAQHVLDLLQKSEGHRAATYRFSATLRRLQAEWALRQKQSRVIAQLVEEGLQHTAHGRRIDALDQELVATEGALHLLASRAAPDSALRRLHAQEALSRFGVALQKNPLLRDEYEPLQKEAQRRAEPIEPSPSEKK